MIDVRAREFDGEQGQFITTYGNLIAKIYISLPQKLNLKLIISLREVETSKSGMEERNSLSLHTLHFKVFKLAKHYFPKIFQF
jgi:hypothetical protein